MFDSTASQSKASFYFSREFTHYLIPHAPQELREQIKSLTMVPRETVTTVYETVSSSSSSSSQEVLELRLKIAEITRKVSLGLFIHSL